MVRGEAMKKEKEAPIKMSKPWIEIETWDDIDEQTQYTLSNPNGYSEELIEKVSMRAMMGGFGNAVAIDIIDMVLEAYGVEKKSNASA
jgi:hypothetical protein